MFRAALSMPPLSPNPQTLSGDDRVACSGSRSTHERLRDDETLTANGAAVLAPETHGAAAGRS